ncbi:hypothetical protein BGZ73_007627 [Actinomortierella ambigua]|nr:hypothetical protein BGZ73_007627 [Actinomortierella ambigua]
MKSSAVKRIMQEARELAREPSTDFAANPLESDIFEWHFTIRGPEGTEFEGGLYHGRILLPNNYPFAPPSLMFLTPNGRFELNKKVCLSITGYHPEYWQPAWGIRTVLVAVMGFLPTESKGAIGGLDTSVEARKTLAVRSKTWACRTCNMENIEILPNVAPEKAVRAQLKESEKADFSFGYEADKKSATPLPPPPQQQQQPQPQQEAVAPQAPTITNEVVKMDELVEESTEKETHDSSMTSVSATQPTEPNPTAVDVQKETLAGTESPQGHIAAPVKPQATVPQGSTEASTVSSVTPSSSVSSRSAVTAVVGASPSPSAAEGSALHTRPAQSSPTTQTHQPAAPSVPRPIQYHPPQPQQLQQRQQQTPLPPLARQANNHIPLWFDALIAGLGGILVTLIFRRFF